MTTEIEVPLYYPKGVTKCLTMGSNNFIGLVDDTTILKYPLTQRDKNALAALSLEARILQLIGPHKHIIGFKGLTDSGLRLERASLGSVATYLESNDPTLLQRLNWACQATQAIIAVHEKDILHRDISAHNLLLDIDLNIKLCDFQGRMLTLNRDVLADGFSVEGTKSYMPRTDSNHADWKTEIFALGSAFYYIMEGHQPFPELDSNSEEEEIEKRFASGRFSEIAHCSEMNRVVHRCWSGGFESAEGVLQELAFVGRGTAAGVP